MRYSQLKVKFVQRILSGPICCPEDSFDFLMKIWDKDLIGLQEQVNILYLNGSNEVISWRCFNTGNGSDTLFDLKLAVACGLMTIASKVIVGHNHPNCILTPSRSDILITQKLKSACEMLDMKLEDHLIICCRDRGFYSFANNGLLR